MSHQCHVTHCRVSTPPKFLMCGFHWKQVPKKLQRAVWDAYQNGQEITKAPSKAWHQAADAAIRYIYEKEFNPSQFRDNKEKSKMAKLELAIMVGAESKEFLNDLTALVDRLEGLMETAPKAADAEMDNAKPAKLGKGKAKAKVEEEETFDLGGEEAESDDEPTVTIKDVIAACRANRETAVKVLKKLKVASVHELKPAQYSKVLAEVGA